MATCGRLVLRLKPLQICWSSVPRRHSNTLSSDVLEKHRKSVLSKDKEAEEELTSLQSPREYRYIYPEFLPNASWMLRDRISEKLERRDMLRRRAVLEIPEFYVGSILAVNVSDPHAPGKKNRFVGICIHREGHGLRAHFTLRNIVDGQGVEIMYEMYNPTIESIEVLKLEKRLDDRLYYLRDAPPEHSTVPFDMVPVSHPPGAPVPVNPIMVQLGPRPWHERWERQDLKGVQDLGLPERFHKRAKELAQPWEKYDLMKQYRSTINEVETKDIMDKVYEDIQEIERKKGKKRMVISSKKKSS